MGGDVGWNFEINNNIDAEQVVDANDGPEQS
jgi:hypothetical protein